MDYELASDGVQALNTEEQTSQVPFLDESGTNTTELVDIGQEIILDKENLQSTESDYEIEVTNVLKQEIRTAFTELSELEKQKLYAIAEGMLKNLNKTTLSSENHVNFNNFDSAIQTGPRTIATTPENNSIIKEEFSTDESATEANFNSSRHAEITTSIVNATGWRKYNWDIEHTRKSIPTTVSTEKTSSKCSLIVKEFD